VHDREHRQVIVADRGEPREVLGQERVLTVGNAVLAQIPRAQVARDDLERALRRSARLCRHRGAGRDRRERIEAADRARPLGHRESLPGALGVLEGGMVLFGAVLGLPAEIALAISLTKRVRELVLGLPGLFAWYWVEGHYLLRRKEDEEV